MSVQPHRDWISKWAVYAAQKVAVKEYETQRSLTYRELHVLGNHVAKVLTDKGLRKGDRIAILSESCLEYYVLFAAAQKTGIVLVPMNYRLSAREIDYLLADCEPAMVIAREKYKPILEACGHYQHVSYTVSMEEFAEDAYSRRFSTYAFQARTDIEDDDPLFILYTSGTTGFPKGALYTHGMLFWNAINTHLRLDISSRDVSIVCTPPFHTGGWNIIPTPFFHHGASFTVMRKFDADAVVRLLEQERVTMFMAVPTMIQMMKEAPSFATADLSSVRYFIIGGEPLPLPVIEEWQRRGIPIRQGFGMTEVGPSVTSLHQDDSVRKIGSIGTLNFYLEARVVDDNGNDVPQGEEGELLLRGHVVTPGYYKNPKATAEAIKDGWFYTGDIVRQDSEGFFYVVDRKKNMYISGGENVYPAEVEKFIGTHEDIAEVAIIGVPDETWGEVGKAFIVRKPSATLSAEEVLSYCMGNLAKYKIPKYIEFLPELPKSDTGKIDRRRLKEMEAAAR
ncbi:MAG: long-chain fatty acid--CoA ligase [Bacteroidota bacterium]|nr:long-chain fatty acid--CoA ligase [Candidatus Kapabacteria bacterium]MDW8220849.1 long-chain fatty acid--CoA ligase [Bacteroidota bacterium]